MGGITGTSADGATVTLSGNNIIYDPTHSATLQALGAGQTATHTFSYTISDGHGGTSTATVSLVVSGINDAPVFTGNDLAQTYHIGDGPVSIVGNVVAGDIDSANYNRWMVDRDRHCRYERANAFYRPRRFYLPQRQPKFTMPTARQRRWQSRSAR